MEQVSSKFIGGQILAPVEVRRLTSHQCVQDSSPNIAGFQPYSNGFSVGSKFGSCPSLMINISNYSQIQSRAKCPSVKTVTLLTVVKQFVVHVFHVSLLKKTRSNNK